MGDEAWPFRGREEVLARCGALLGHPGTDGFVLAGSFGVGKSRLLDECADRARRAGFAVLRATGHRAGTSIPFAAVAPLLPPGTQMVARGLPMLRQAQEALLQQAGGRPLVVAVDDAHLLDDASALLLHQLGTSKVAFVMATVAPDPDLPDPVRSLWQASGAERVEVGTLDRSAVADVLSGALGGLVDSTTIDAFWSSSGGNALALRELVRGSIEAATLALDGELWSLRGPLAPSARLRERVAARLAGLAPQERGALELLAIGEPVDLAVVDTHEPSGVESLERRGLARVQPSGARTMVSVAHPSDAEVVRATVGVVRGRSLRVRLAEAIEAAGARRREDVLRLATFRLDGGGAVDPAILDAAARQAFVASDLVLAERLALASLEAAPSFAARHLVNEIRHRTGGEAIAEGDEHDPADDEQRCLAALTEGAMLFWRLGRHAEADAVLERAIVELAACPRVDELGCLRATLAANAGQPRRALALVEAAAPRSAPARVQGAVAASIALRHVGRAEDGLAVVASGWAAHEESVGQPSMLQATLLAVNESAALLEVGRLADASAVAVAAYDRSTLEHDAPGQALSSLVAGRAALARGAVTEALRWSRESMALCGAVGHLGPQQWAAGGVVLAAALRGDVPMAERLLAWLDDSPTHPAATLYADVERGRAWAAVAAGDPASARAVLLTAVATCGQRGEVSAEVMLLHDVVRLGGATDAVTARLAELVADVQGDWLPALAADARAAAGRRSAPLAASCERLEGLGALLLAAEAATRAGAALAQEGQQREAAAWRRRAGALIDRCEGARTPALSQSAGPIPLTGREREIALLASSGLTSRTIGERLHLSVRTVDNNLARIFTKLGISERSAITAALDAE